MALPGINLWKIHTFVSKSESAHLGEKFEGLEANDTSTF